MVAISPRSHPPRIAPPARTALVPRSAPALCRRATATFLLVLCTAAHPAPPTATLIQVGEELASRLASERPQPELIALLVSAPGAQLLAPPLETAVAAALARRGFSTAPLSATEPADPTLAARQLGADRLLRVVANVLQDQQVQLALTAESWPTRPSFFLQHAPQVRPGSGKVWTFTLPADPATLALARASPHASLKPVQLVVKPLFRLGERVLALAAGDPTGDGTMAIAVVTSSSLSLFGRTGNLLARRELDPIERVRYPAALVTMGNFTNGRIALQLAGEKAGSVLSYGNGTLRPAAPLPAFPLATFGQRQLLGSFLPGRATFTDRPQAEPPPRSSTTTGHPAPSHEWTAFAAAPRSGRITSAALQRDGLLLLLGPDLSSVDAPLADIGAGFALADLDGSGEPKLVASSAEPGGSDRIRVLSLRPGGAEQLFESRPIVGSILAGTAGDITGDGLDDALLASVLSQGETQLWLVSADPRFAKEPAEAPATGARSP